MSEPAVSNGPDRDDVLFAKNMARIREQKGMSQADLVRILNDNGWTSIYQTTISRIEKGDRTVRYGEARAIARALGVSLNRFSLSATESRLAGRLVWARERLTEAASRIRDDTVGFLDAEKHLESVIAEAKDAGHQPTDLPDDDEATIAPVTVDDELALSIYALEANSPEAAVDLGRFFARLPPTHPARR